MKMLHLIQTVPTTNKVMKDEEIKVFILKKRVILI